MEQSDSSRHTRPKDASLTEPAGTPFPETPDIATASDGYARRFSGEVGDWFLQVQKEAVLRMLATCPGSRILDVGGGHGQLTAGLLDAGYTVTVFGSAEVCKQQIEPLLDEDRCFFEAGNLLQLPYQDQSFDAVISVRTLPHLVQWDAFLIELARVTYHTLLVDYPAVRSANYLAPLLFDLKKRAEGNTRPYKCFYQSEIVAVLHSSGLQCTDRYPQFLLPMVLYRLGGSRRIASTLENVFRRVGLTERFGSPVILKCVRRTPSSGERGI